MGRFIERSGLVIVLSIFFIVLSASISTAIKIKGASLEGITGKVPYGNFSAGICVSTNIQINKSTCHETYFENETINCNITVTGHNATGFSSQFIEGQTLFIINNTTGDIYKERLNFSDIGNYTVIVYVNYTNECMDTFKYAIYHFEVARISNRPPVCLKDIKDIEIPQGSNLVIMMGTYCTDPDNDPINFTFWVDKAFIGFSINIVDEELSLITDAWFYGELYLSFNATDTFNTSDSTNIFKVTIIPTPQPNPASNPPPQPPSVTGSNNIIKTTIVMCMPKWECKEFGPCLPTGNQERECVDLNNCNITLLMPNTTNNCTYSPNCFDGIQNQNEAGTDCGGSCTKKCGEAETCFDGIKNGDEQDTDCGGSCTKKCGEAETCFDGIKNGDEQDTDCGGSCTKKCPAIEQPLIIGTLKFIPWVLIIIMILASIYYLMSKMPRRLKFRKIRRIIGKKTNGNDLMKRLDELEKNLLKAKIDVTLSKLAEIFEDYFIILLQSKQIVTEDELRKKVMDSDIKNVLKEFILGMYKDISEIEYSKEELSRIEVLLLIYESKNMVMATLLPIGYLLKEITDLKPNNEEEELFKQLSYANYDLLAGSIWSKAKIKELKKVLITKNIKNKFLINSYNRLLMLEWNRYAERK